MMLARVADSLYWIGRYVERAEHVSRLSDIMLTATLDQNEAAIDVAHVALAAVGEPVEAAAQRNTLDAVYNLVFNREDEGSVVTSLSRCRENALQSSVPVIKGGCVERHHRFVAISCARGELVVGNLFLA